MTCLKRILLDMDGVLCRFHEAAMRFHGVPTCCYPLGVDSIQEACQRLKPDFNLSNRQFWEPFGFDFWAGLEPCPGHEKIVERACHLVGLENVFICTIPTLGTECAAGKIAWINEHLPQFKRQFIICTKKYPLAQPGVLLVDDRVSNCQEFLKHGGEVVLVPRPWNFDFDKAGSWLDVTLKRMEVASRG